MTGRVQHYDINIIVVFCNPGLVIFYKSVLDINEQRE